MGKNIVLNESVFAEKLDSIKCAVNSGVITAFHESKISTPELCEKTLEKISVEKIEKTILKYIESESRTSKEVHRSWFLTTAKSITTCIICAKGDLDICLNTESPK